jgi:hypothetical protein
MNDPRQRAMDMVLGSGSKGPMESAPAEAPEESEGGMTCPKCGTKFEAVVEAPAEESMAPEGMGGM